MDFDQEVNWLALPLTNILAQLQNVYLEEHV